MQRMLDLAGATLGGWLGWTLGIHVGIMTAFIVGMVGTGAGLYAARRVTAGLRP